MLTGKYTHSVDAKNRIIIPAKLKEQLGEPITVLKSPSDRCLTLYSKTEWESYAEKLGSLPQTKMRGAVRFLYANSLEVVPDAQGRIMLPQEMLDHAGIKKNILTAGCGRYAEMWAAEIWEEQGLDEAPEGMTAVLEELGL